jgi:phosphocarrier protein
MVRELKVINQLGLHARPAALFVKTASRFESDISVAKDGNSVSGKSIMGLMTLEAGLGSVLMVTAEGMDAEESLNELQHLVDSKFFEE